MSEPLIEARFLNRRFQVVNVAWRRQGPRQGLLRRRKTTLRSKLWAEADSLAMAAALLAEAPLYADEAIYAYDRYNQSRAVAAKYGWAWKS